MKIGVDIDDVLAQWNSPFLNFVNKTHGTNYRFEDVTGYDYSKTFSNLDIDFFELCFEFYKSDDFSKLPMVEGAYENLELIANGNKLYAITSRPEIIAATTKNWIGTNFEGKFIDVIFTNQFTNNSSLKQKLKSQVCVELEIELMIEDAAHHAEDIAAKNIRVILLDKPWNKDFRSSDKITKVKSWSEIPGKITKTKN